MGELLPSVPTTPNNVTDSWQPLVESNVMSSYGMNVVTLTEWSTSTVIPAIAQGSAIDIDGSTARFVTGEAITDAPGNGTVYVMFIVSGSTVTAELTATAPIWDNTKGGWYGATGNRYSGHLMTKNGTAYTRKTRLRDEAPWGGTFGGMVYASGLTPDGSLADSFSITLSPSEIWTIPEGMYFLGVNPGILFSDFEIQFNTSSGFKSSSFGGMVLSNGVDFQVQNVIAAVRGFYYRKIW